MRTDDAIFLDRCIAQLDEGVLLANSIGTSSMYRWTNDASDLLREIRQHRKEKKEELEIDVR